MTPVELSRTVLRAVRRAVEDGELRVAVPEKASVTVPGAGGWGDYATNIALQLARPAGETPRRVAELLRPHLAGAHGVSGVEITGPGFLNISLGSTASTALVEEILRRGPRYGFVEVVEGDGTSHAGPTDHPVHLHAPHDPRALVLMDVIARLLRSQGTPVRTSCETRPEPEWTAALRIGVDAYGAPAAPAAPAAPVPLDVHVRPVPAPDLAELLSLGPDAARWALLHPAAHDRPRPTADLLVQGEGNPLFRVRYAYARTRAVSRNAADLGFTAQPGDVEEGVPEDVHGDTAPTTAPPVRTPPLVHTSPLAHPAPLLTHLADHPRLLARAAAHRAPDLLARHLVAVADATLPLVPATLPLGDEKPLAAHRARLALAEAAGVVLAGGLSLLGIDAPEHL
ncbi:DALR anticodon-binding domain-containing protein [Streptomyces sp. NBC_01239]|uniref:ArgS-related anticodon-binding protein NrtL n=1 Tax=Streptomyces sp. NBC_01239 TaxID=2903792 RepID=UPI002256272D|nr:DALR anticodon-binding domain-containing protein [Streptomyces sp. NBC_01239]MCX4813864.1 DALR anticodon-binding domain-containing protein [Streptomyces sp. NBC_01239]